MRTGTKDGILDYATTDQAIDGARLKQLRRAAARLEKPRTGTFLQVTEDGRAIATGEKGTRIPETFIRFAQQNGLRFEARRIVPQYGKARAMTKGQTSGTASQWQQFGLELQGV